MERPAAEKNGAVGRRLRRVVHAFLASRVRWKALFLFLVLMALMLTLNGMNVMNSYIGRDFVSAIERRDVPGFVSQGGLYFGIFIALAIVSAWFRFAEERLALLWREWQTREFLRDFLDRRSYFHLGRLNLVENPDQNIAEDVKSFTTTTLSFVLMLLNATFTVIAFSGVLWTISPRLSLVAVGYAIVGTLMTVFMGRPLIRLHDRQLDKEANFRSELLHARENSEAIAVLRREGRLTEHLTTRLDGLVANWRRIIAVNRNLAFFTTGYNYMIQLIPFLIVAPLFIDGKAEFGVVTQSAMAFAHLMGAFSLIVTQFQSISTYGAVVSRLGRLMEGLELARSKDGTLVEECKNGDLPGFESLTLWLNGNGETVLFNLNLRIEKGQWILIDGNEEAKRALFRAMAGVWSGGTGSVYLPDRDHIAFVPERPYHHTGTLRDTLVYIRYDHLVPDEKVVSVLRELGLASLVERVHATANWQEILPLATQQMLVIARVLLSGSDFVVLDHIFTALSPEEVRVVLTKLRARGITCVCFGSGDDDPLDFDHLLSLSQDGTWELISLPVIDHLSPESDLKPVRSPVAEKRKARSPALDN